MTDDEFNAWASRHPLLRRSIAEYSTDRAAAIERFMNDHPVEAVTAMLDLISINRHA